MIDHYFDMTDKVVLVTGGTRGLGYEMVKGFAKMGAHVAVSSRKRDACEVVAREIERMGNKAFACPCHVGHWNELPALVDTVYGNFGRVDVLINNAGIGPAIDKSSNLSEDLFDKIIGVNFKGLFRLSALVGDRMKAAGSGNIINITSTGAIRPRPNSAVYSGAKSAANVITRAHAFEFGPEVRVNAIMCGPFWTDISKSWREEADKNSPAAAGRIGRAHEVVTTALYLASDHSSFTTGSIITLDGGML